MRNLVVLSVFVIFLLGLDDVLGLSRSKRAQNFVCGVAHQGIGLIVGGKTAKKGDFPWFAALFKRDETGKNAFFCGGVLVSHSKILTAAHCILLKNAEAPIAPRDVTVFLGGYDLKNPFEPGTLSVSPESLIVHPHWNPFSARFDADLAIVLLPNSINFGANIVPICMLNPGQGINVQEGTVVGYGQSEDKTKEHETIPRVLDVPIKNNEQCFLDNYLFAKLSSNRTFCAGSLNGMGACRGDSGSGLFIKIGSTFYLRGIVSSSLFDSKGNCDVNNYAVYTDIPQFLKWIENPNDPSTLLDTPQIKIQSTTNPPVTFQASASPLQPCGLMNEPSNLIQGGQKSSRRNFPWTVAIFVREGFDLYEHKAVGTLISNKHVVSLGNPLSYLDNANVLLPIDVNRLKMYFGVENLSESYVSGALIIDGAEKIVLHPNIRIETPRSADIAVVFLQSPIFMTSFISPVCLMEANTNLEVAVKVAYAVGWGVNEAGLVSEFKKQTIVTILNQDICHQSFSNFFTSGIKYFCVGSADKISTPCDLDDPLYMKLNQRWYLKGLINVYFFNPDENKCSATSPVLYEDISLHTNWIQSAIK